MNIPADLKFTENDEWIKVVDNVGRIGITDYAQEQLSDIVFVEIIAGLGESLNKGDSCATIESVKAAADVYIPVSGKVVEVNESLADTPELINQDPYGAAWLVVVELSNLDEIDTLLDAEAYKAFCEGRQT
jgi:glycine cleavage system H protein